MKFFKVLLMSTAIVVPAMAQTPTYLDPKAPIEDRVKDALGRMTLEVANITGNADAISGKTNPSGKLPFSFPKRLEDWELSQHISHFFKRYKIFC